MNAYEVSAIDGQDIGPDGEYGYPYLDHYWGEADDRDAFLFYVDGRLAVPGHQVGSRLMGGSPPSAVWRRTVL